MLVRAVTVRWALIVALVLLAAVLLGAVVPSGSIAERGHHQHKKGHHRQAVKGSLHDAHVKIVKAPPVYGKGGGVDPGDDYPTRWKNPPQDSVVDQWGMYNRECTSFVAWALHSRNGFEVPFHQNANRWGPMAAARDFVVNSHPSVGSVAWSNAGAYGHVAYVVAVNGGNVTVAEYNYIQRGVYDKRVVSSSAFNGYIHFKDLPTESVSASPPAASTPSSPTGPASTPTTPSAPYAETTGGVTHTWTNYANAGGTEGPTIPSNMTVQISCALTGFRVADGNTWWYRISSSPWNNAYYASADAFYNNGQTTGSLKGTPFVDPAVRGC